MGTLIGFAVVAIFGFVSGILVYRNNTKTLDKIFNKILSLLDGLRKE